MQNRGESRESSPIDSQAIRALNSLPPVSQSRKESIPNEIASKSSKIQINPDSKMKEMK